MAFTHSINSILTLTFLLHNNPTARRRNQLRREGRKDEHKEIDKERLQKPKYFRRLMTCQHQNMHRKILHKKYLHGRGGEDCSFQKDPLPKFSTNRKEKLEHKGSSRERVKEDFLVFFLPYLYLFFTLQKETCSSEH